MFRYLLGGLTLLEVQFLDCENENAGKENVPNKQPNASELEKAPVKSEVILDILVHIPSLSTSAGYYNL